MGESNSLKRNVRLLPGIIDLVGRPFASFLANFQVVSI